MDLSKVLNSENETPGGSESRLHIPARSNQTLERSLSPETAYRLMPPIATVNSSYTTTDPYAYRSRQQSTSVSPYTSPALSSTSIAAPSPHSSRSSPPGSPIKGESNPSTPTLREVIFDHSEVARSQRPSSVPERRDSRPTYTTEEAHFIWFHRDDLGEEWAEIQDAFNTQFNKRSRKGFQGIQCRYYRCLVQYKIPKARQRPAHSGGSTLGCWGIRKNLPQAWYPWMEGARRSPSGSAARLPAASPPPSHRQSFEERLNGSQMSRPMRSPQKRR